MRGLRGVHAPRRRLAARRRAPQRIARVVDAQEELDRALVPALALREARGDVVGHGALGEVAEGAELAGDASTGTGRDGGPPGATAGTPEADAESRATRLRAVFPAGLDWEGELAPGTERVMVVGAFGHAIEWPARG